MQTGQELFVHELNDMMDAERQLIETLRQNAEECSRPDLKRAFEQHRKETENQLERLNQCFELLAEEPQEAECYGIRGLIEEKKVFLEEEPSPDLIEVFDVGAAIKAESYEICAYESLIHMAEEMEENKVAQLLHRTLREEQATLKKMQGFSQKVKPKWLTEEDVQEEEPARSSRGKRAA
jgi:ferritin-like metal-binding protein YciE